VWPFKPLPQEEHLLPEFDPLRAHFLFNTIGVAF